MKISFFQTYGDRLPLLKIRTKDLIFQNFLNNFDLNILSLHNVTDNVRNYVKNNKIIPNQINWDFKDINYGECLKTLIEFLKSKNTSKFFFYQDDTFSYEITDKIEQDLKKLLLSCNLDLINLSYKIDYLKEHQLWNEEKKIIYQCPSFNLFDTDTFDFKKSGLWSFDDSCFLCTLEKIINIYDQTYLNFSNIWDAEIYLKRKYEKINMLRPITNISFFINYNIMGRNVRPENLDNLKKHIELTEEILKFF